MSSVEGTESCPFHGRILFYIAMGTLLLDVAWCRENSGEGQEAWDLSLDWLTNVFVTLDKSFLFMGALTSLSLK